MEELRVNTGGGAPKVSPDTRVHRTPDAGGVALYIRGTGGGGLNAPLLSDNSSGSDRKHGDMSMSKVTPFLMFNDQLEAAIAFYTATFPDSSIKNVARTGNDGPVTSAEFVIGGQSFMGYNGDW